MVGNTAFGTLEKWGRTSPFGMLRFAHQYLIAAQTLHLHMVGSHVPMPKYTNIGLSIELAMKAFLLADGLTVRELRSAPYGHDLESLFNSCIERGIEQQVDFPELYRGTIVTLSEPYKAQVLRYIVNGTLTLPKWEWLDLTASRLTDDLRRFCLVATLGEPEAERAMAARGDRW
jgi:hypothetical protein